MHHKKIGFYEEKNEKHNIYEAPQVKERHAI